MQTYDARVERQMASFYQSLSDRPNTSLCSHSWGVAPGYGEN